MTTIKLRRDTAANWLAANPVLALAEPGFETDTGKLKIGNGNDNWSTLPYVSDTGNVGFEGSWIKNVGTDNIFISPQDGNTFLNLPSDTQAGTDPVQLGNLDSAGSVEIVAGRPQKTWRFGTDGRTTFPSATIPITSKGSSGDHAGQVAFDSDYIYYCTASYDGDNNIWKRVALDATSWDNTPPPPPPTLVSIAIAPANSNVFTGNDTTVQFTATGTYSDASTADITMLVTWESTYGMTNYSIDSTGLLLLMEGETNSTTITATLNGITSSTGLTFA